MKHLLKFENYGKLPVMYDSGWNVPKTVTINGGNKWQYNNNNNVWTNLGPTNEYDGIYTFAGLDKFNPIYQYDQQNIIHFGGVSFGPSGDTPPYENNLYGLMWLYDGYDSDEYYIEISEVSDTMINPLPISATISNFTSDDANIIVPDGTILYLVVNNHLMVYKNEAISIVDRFSTGYNEGVTVTTNDDVEVTASFNAKFNYIGLTPPFVVLLKDSLPMSFDVNADGNITYTYIGKNNKDRNGNTVNWFYVYCTQTNNYYRILNDRTSLPNDATNVTYGGYTFDYYDGNAHKFISYPDPITDYVPTAYQ